MSILKSKPPVNSILIQVNGNEFDVPIKRNPKRRRLAIKLTHDGLVVSAPTRASSREILQFLDSARGWIESAQQKHQSMENQSDSAAIMFGGDDWRIIPLLNQTKAILIDHAEQCFRVRAENQLEARQKLERWLKKQASELIQSSVRTRAKSMELFPVKVSIRDQKSRWGSCSSTGTISINWRLIMAPPEILDYIVVHELAHLKEMNHSPNFWKLVETHCPEYKRCEKWIKREGSALMRRY